ncbi:hypothetical protein C5Y93_04830 [Blastopirellula marina]|uniref:Uncharacterized protein n=1 Tax=Blastopirellula marina TaxID=124 RepID=A0A2S8GSH3_9BACT|nr:hypothetical protein C5Y93_04830 [Blastopirellula marina]
MSFFFGTLQFYHAEVQLLIQHVRVRFHRAILLHDPHLIACSTGIVAFQHGKHFIELRFKQLNRKLAGNLACIKKRLR